jgi:4-amino-4-deoxy-L-arabinose transferase-like glycosyltransferase
LDNFGKVLPKLDGLLLVLLIFIPRLLNLDVFLTADEPLFLDQAREFAAGITTGGLSRTLGIGYPGVTVAAWAAPAVTLMQSIGQPELLSERRADGFLKTCQLCPAEMRAYAAGRMATACMTGVLLLLLYSLARLLLGRRPAFLGVMLLALDPYSLAYSRLLHVEAPLALFMSLAGLSFLLWLHQERQRWLVWSGVFTGLALLTKSTALLLGPMLGAMLLIWELWSMQWRDGRWWLRSMGGGLLMVLIAGFVFTALWPAMWIDPAGALSLTFDKLFTDQEAGTGNLGLFWLGHFVEDPGPLFYPVAFILKATPWLLIGLFLSLIYSIFSIERVHDWGNWHPSIQFSLRSNLLRMPGRESTHHAPRAMHHTPLTHQLLITLSLWAFALAYLILMTIASKKSTRYMLPAFPVFYLLAGSAIYQTHLLLKSRSVFRILPRFPAPLLPGLTIMALVLFTFFYHPYYFTYYNPLVLGWRWAPQTLLVGWGEGLDGAARYLNSQPQLSHQPRPRVSAWYEWLFPILYTDGEVEPVVPQENLITADRVVLYINQVQRDIPSPNIIHYFRARRQPEYTVRLAGIDYVWVYAGPIAGFRTDLSPQYRLEGEFGPASSSNAEARLLGYDLYPQPVKGGEALIVTLYWRALATPSAERFVYTRLVDARGRIWARTDGPPVMGLWPATRWQPEMVIEDAHELPVPAGTPPGIYRLEVGLYDPGNGRPLVAAGQPIGQGGGLLLGEARVEWQPHEQLDVVLSHQVEANLGPTIRLIGYDALPGSVTTGEIIPARLAWRNTRSIFSFAPPSTANPVVGFRWKGKQIERLSQSDPLPLPPGQWERQAILLSQHDIVAPPDLEAGQYELQVILHQGGYEPAGEVFSLGRIEVGAPPHRFDLPAGAASPVDDKARLGGQVALAGYEVEVTAQGLIVNLYWQTQTPLGTGYKVFAQLLDAESQLVAQSDALPTAGQRPTTGWLPGEIITDTHTLLLPADLRRGGQTYRLIAGLYDPLDGQRLPALDEAGEIAADALVVTQVSLP